LHGSIRNGRGPGNRALRAGAAAHSRTASAASNVTQDDTLNFQ
jgi:hypothetical protein